METATFEKLVRADSDWPDMIFSLSKPRPFKIIDGNVISTNHILIMNTYFFGHYILTLALPCSKSGEVESFLDNQLGNIQGEHNPDKLLAKLGYTTEWGEYKPKTVSKGA